MTSLITPAIGLVFWTLFIFLILLTLLRKFAWRPILSAVKNRDHHITSSLAAAEQANKDLLAVEEEKVRLMLLAQREKDKLVKEGKRLQDTLIKEAKQKADVEANKIIAKAKTQLESERIAMVERLKQEVGVLAIDLAKEILQKELAAKEEHQAFIQKTLKEVHFN